jgi:hypothetical protein
MQLSDVTQMANWPTATVNDATGSQYAYSSGDRTKPVLKLPGAVQQASSAETASTEQYRLNPAFSAWLMGFPSEWTMAGHEALTAFRSQKKRRSRKAE